MTYINLVFCLFVFRFFIALPLIVVCLEQHEYIIYEPFFPL